MTVETDTSRVSYAGSGSTGPFTIPFYFLEDEDIRVVRVTTATGAETELSPSEFSITGAGDANGGELTLAVALTSSYGIVIFRDPALVQESEYPPNDPFPSSTNEQVADRGMMVNQRTRELVERALHLPDGDADLDMTLPPSVDRANKLLSFDSNGEPSTTEAVDAASTTVVASGGTASRLLSDRFTDILNLKDFGAVADATGDSGVGVGNSSIVNDAITACAAAGLALFITAGMFRMDDVVQLRDDTVLIGAGPTVSVLFMDFSTTAAWMDQYNYADEVAINRVHLEGFQIRGRSDWSNDGDGIRGNFDDFTVKDVHVRYCGNQGRVMVWGGNRHRISGIRATDPYITASGGGGLRYLFGTDMVCSDCYVHCDDDAFTFCPTIAAAANGDLSIRDAHFVNCTGISNRARLISAVLSDNTQTGGMTNSITKWSFTDCSGIAPVTGTANGISVWNIDSTGSIKDGSFKGCSVNAGTSTSARVVDVMNQYTGTVEDIDFVACSVIDPYTEAFAIRINGGSVKPKHIRWNGGHIDGPRASGQTLNIREGDDVYFSNVRITGCDTHDHDVVVTGGSTTNCNNVNFTDVVVDEVGDSGGANYAFNWARCDLGKARDVVIKPYSGASTSVRAHQIGSNSNNIRLQGGDISRLSGTASTKITVSGTSVRINDIKGFVTRNSGTDAIASGATTKTVSHGLQVTPTLDSITLTFGEQAALDYGRFWISNITSTQFTVNVASNPGTTGLDFGWRAVKERVA